MMADRLQDIQLSLFQIYTVACVDATDLELPVLQVNFVSIILSARRNADMEADRLATLLNDVPQNLDLTDTRHLARVGRLADEIAGESRDLAELEKDWANRKNEIPLMAHLAVKLARSRALLRKIDGPIRLSVIFAVYKEHTRILTHAEHPHGEDFLREKARQLRWLFEGLDQAAWDLTIVDDGCPESSGRIADMILAEDSHVDGRVLFLNDACSVDHPAVRPLASPDESRKGGSILYGLWEAARKPDPRHVVLFTDADLSTHLGQAGLLIHEILAGGADAAIGSRREPTSVAIKKGTRNVRGKLFIYLWKRLFPPLREIVDTQCGFKAFRADMVREICADTIEKQFAFDIELLLRTELRRAGSIRKVPVAWIDSEAASTTTDLQPYLPMLQTMVAMYRRYLPKDAAAEAFSALIESLDQTTWDRLVDHVPDKIATREPREFGDWCGVSADTLRDIARG